LKTYIDPNLEEDILIVDSPSKTPKRQIKVARKSLPVQNAKIDKPVLRRSPRNLRQLRLRNQQIIDKRNQQENENSTDQSESGTEYESDESQAVLDESDGEAKQDDTEAVFFNQKVSKSSTSNNTLKFEKQIKQIERIDVIHDKLIDNLKIRTIKHFVQYRFELQQGFGLLFYGYGSKISIIKDFVKTLKSAAIYIKGFHLGLKFDLFLTELLKVLPDSRNIVNSSPEKAIGGISRKSSQLVNEVFQRLELLKKPLSLVIFNFELLKFDHQTEFLIFLQKIKPKINFITTIDHLNSFVKYEAKVVQGLNLVFHDSTTFVRFGEENSYEGGIMEKQVTSVGVSYLLRSLGPNARYLFLIYRKIFYLLIEKQLEIQEDGNQGIGYEQLFRYKLLIEIFSRTIFGQ
jgi:origin recognition complex subunit 2